jgi:hypothetical protein
VQLPPPREYSRHLFILPVCLNNAPLPIFHKRFLAAYSVRSAAEIPVRSITPENKSRVPPIMPEKGLWDIATRKEAINSFLEELRPKVKEFLTSHRRLPVWMPPETVDANTRQFYDNLAIPRINDKPNLLLHNLGSETNPNGDTLFKNGANHR